MGDDDRFRQIFEAAPNALLVVDERGLVTLVNRRAERLFGYERAEILGQPVEMLVPERFRRPYVEEHHPRCPRSVLGDLDSGRDLFGLRKDGSEVPVELGSNLLLNEQGRSTLVSVADVSERKRREESLRRQAEETLRETEHQLRQSQKIEAIGRLAGGIAHDFNNFLTIISASVGLLLGRDQWDDSSRRLVQNVKQAGERAADLTRQLLAFSRKQILRPTTLDLGRLVADLSRMLQPLIGEDVVLTTTAASDLWPIEADRGQIEQVILNLAVNARDAMPRGGRLTVEVDNVELDEDVIHGRAELRPGRFVRLAVSDTGAGMDEATCERIFEPFFTTKEAGKGTGLGLASAYGVVKQSGGFIYVYSEVGQGTTFKLYFPASCTGEMAAAPAPADAVEGGDETLLLVEDDGSLRALLASALRDYGYTILEARGGEEALRCFAQHGEAIDLVTTDVVMPGMSGRDLSERVLAVNPAVKVLFISGYTDDAVVLHGVLEGHAAFLQKPFSPTTLARKVREVLDPEPTG